MKNDYILDDSKHCRPRFWPLSDVKKYSPDQARDYHGRFADEGGGEQAADQGEHSVGLTTAKPGRSTLGVYREMGRFEGKLKALPGVSEVEVSPAYGQSAEWGGEPSWSVSYKGNGEARDLVGRVASGEMFGEATKQDSAFIITGGCRSGCVPVAEYKFDGHLSNAERSAADSAMKGAGFGGWTVFHDAEGKLVYRAVHIPQWSGKSAKEFLRSSHDAFQNFQRIRSLPNASERTGFKLSRFNAKLDILESANDYGRR